MSRELISKIEVGIGMEGNDFLNDLITLRIDEYIYANKIEDKEIDILFDRPTFFDWILRRKRIKKLNIIVKEILKNPPKNNKDTIKVMLINEL